MNDLDVRKRIDLHFGRTNFTSNTNYVEFYFHCCFYELFNIESCWESDLEGIEILDLLKCLEIDFDKEFLIDAFKNQKNHSVEVFHSNNDEQVFAYFDLKKDPTDQNDMFFLGISCRQKNEPQIHEMLLNIYRKLKTTSSFNFDIYNKRLYNKVFQSFFYFYENYYSENKRQIHNHNLTQRDDTINIDYLKYKEIISKSEATEEHANELAEESKENWWAKNKKRFLK
jgi:hypothetical protein